jgi:phosphate starvation-inducible PhoH-like protein
LISKKFTTNPRINKDLHSRYIQIEKINPAEFFGPNNSNLKHLKTFFPALKISSRGNELTVFGDDETMDEFERKFQLLVRHFNQFNALTENNIDNLMLEEGSNLLSVDDGSETLVHGNGGAKIKARTVNQKKLVQAVNEHDMVFAVGPAGTGKTYTAVALAVRALKNKEVKRIVLTRPAVEAGENLGFLPGDLKEKLDPYLMPLYDALRDMIPGEKLADMLEYGIIEIAPLAFMRGRTLDKAFVILDEAQNTTKMQMKMFLTRMGMTAKFVITGDLSQIDLPNKQTSGLAFALDNVKNIEEIGIVRLGQSDVIRHRLVKKIIDAFDKAEAEEKIKKENERTDKNKF